MNNKRVDIDLHKYFVAIFFVVMLTLFVIVTFVK